MAHSEVAVTLAKASVSDGCRWAFSAADAVELALTRLASAMERHHLLSILSQTLDNVLNVMLQVSKLGEHAADRGAYTWIRRLQDSSDVPEKYQNMPLLELVTFYRTQDEADRTGIWPFKYTGYDLRFLSFDERLIAGWRFILEPGGDVTMEPFQFSADATTVMTRHLANPGDLRTDLERASLREALFGPWIDLKREVGLPLADLILLRRTPAIGGLDLELLAAGTDSLPAWPALRWFDHTDDPSPGEERG